MNYLSLGEVIEPVFGTRIVQRNDGGSRYPVYGGGGETFKSDTHNREDDLVISRFALSKRCVRFLKGKFFLNDSGLTIKVINSDFSKEYVQCFLLSHQDDVYNCSRGAAQRNLDISRFLSLKIPHLGTSDQKKLVQANNLSSSLIENRRNSIAKLDKLAQSIFLDMFGDPLTNPKGFPIRSIKEFYIDEKNGTKCGPFGTALKKHEYVDQGVAVWNMDNISLQGELIGHPRLWITEEKFKDLEGYSVNDGDVIISRAGTVGKMCVVRSNHTKSLISTNLIRVRFGKMLLPEYFVFLMTFCKGRVGRLKTGSDGAFTHMNGGILDNLKIPYPSLDLQLKYLDIFSSLNCIKVASIKSETELIKLHLSLIQKYFN